MVFFLYKYINSRKNKKKRRVMKENNSTEFQSFLKNVSTGTFKYFCQFNYPLNEKGHGVSTEFFSGNEETAKTVVLDAYKKQFGNEVKGNIVKFIRYRWAREVHQFCEDKYGEPYPEKIECGRIVWLNRPYFAMVNSPMQMKSIPYLIIEKIAVETDEHDLKQLTPDQLKLLGIDFDPYECKPKDDYLLIKFK